jgi:hypothetical protein
MHSVENYIKLIEGWPLLRATLKSGLIGVMASFEGETEI